MDDHPLLGSTPSRRPPTVFLVALLWTALLVVVSVQAVAHPRSHTVYPIFANAGESWRDGVSVYGDKRIQGLDFFRYSPTVAAFFVPLSALPLWIGGIVWRLANAGAFLGGLAWWCRAALPSGLSQRQVGWIFFLTLPLSIASIHNGQSNPLVLGLLLGTVAAAAQGRWTLAAAAVVVATVFKIYPLSVGLLIAVAFPRTMGWRLAAALAVAAIIPFFTQRPSYVAGQYVEWISYLGTDSRHHVAFERSYRDLRFLFRAWGGRLDDGAFTTLQLLGAGASALACLNASRRRWPARRLLTLALGLGTLWMTLLGPATEALSYMLIGPSLAWGLVAATAARRRDIQAVLGVAFVLCAVDPLSQPIPGGAVVRHIGILQLGAILTLVGLIWQELTTPLPHALSDDLVSIGNEGDAHGIDHDVRPSAAAPPIQPWIPCS